MPCTPICVCCWHSELFGNVLDKVCLTLFPFGYTADETSRVFAVGDASGEHTVVQPPGLLSTGLAEAFIAVRAAFPEQWEGTFADVIARRPPGSYTPFEKYPAVAIWLEDGVGLCVSRVGRW